MDDSKNDNPQALEVTLICFCHGVPEQEIRQAIRDGCHTLLQIKERTKASTGCGGCTCEVEAILQDELKRLETA